MAKRTIRELGELQAEILEHLWDEGEATVARMVEIVGKRRKVTYTTVLVAMQKLTKKGWLTYRQQGKAYVYRPRKSRADARRGVVRGILQSAFGGDAHLLLASLLDEVQLSDEELRELRRLIDQHRSENKK